MVEHFYVMRERVTGNILILDDDRIQHLLFKKKIGLLNSGVDLVFFEDAELALDFIQKTPPAVVISDINLNQIDGWQFLDEVSKLNFKGDFFLLSGSIYPDDRNRAKSDSRVSGFFEKPIQEVDLVYILGLPTF